jgi:hypothetical protein
MAMRPSRNGEPESKKNIERYYVAGLLCHQDQVIQIAEHLPFIAMKCVSILGIPAAPIEFHG